MRRCLQNHGIWLELFAYVSAKRSGLFSDVRTSVLVDWDGSEYNNKGTRNEVDVLAVHNVTPVFISCKMGVPTPLALSEIKMLSDKFGGERTQTVLLTAADVEKKIRLWPSAPGTSEFTCLTPEKWIPVLWQSGCGSSPKNKNPGISVPGMTESL